jgi:hypothetical protein
MVFDLGGGTLDVSILEVGNGVIEVRTPSNAHTSGGECPGNGALDVGSRWSASSRCSPSRPRAVVSTPPVYGSHVFATLYSPNKHKPLWTFRLGAINRR